METREITVGGLFRGEVRLLVPRYQRPYVWSQKNWAALWNDMVGAITRHDDEDSGRAGGDDVPRHFLGAVVLRSQSLGGPTTMVERQVIDGQQRLATLQVLFAAVHEVARSHGVDGRYLAALRKLTHNDDEMSNDDDDRFKLWPTRYDWVAFRAAIQLEPGSAAEPGRRESGRRASSARRESGRHTLTAPQRPPSGHALVLARAYFAVVVAQWLRTGRPADANAKLERLLTLVNHGLRLIVIDLSPTDNPQIIFESLNARGMPLQTSDLVRNHIFHLAEAQRLNSDRLYEEHWARFEDGFWKQPSGRGPRGGTRLDTFLAYFLAMELRRTLNHQELYPTFREYIAIQAQSLPALLARFAAYGELYRALEQRVDLEPDEAQFMARLEVLGTDAILPLILAIFGEYEDPVRRSMLELVESYLIRRVIVGGAARDYGSVAAAVLRRLATSSAEPQHAMREQLCSYTTTDAAWPGDADVLAFARDRSMEHIPTRRIRLILSVVDQGLRTPRHEAFTYDIDDLTLEHLMPRAWNEHWPVSDPAAAALRGRLVSTLGNLTLITGPFNVALGNAAWAVKRTELMRYSRLLLNESLPEVWDEAAIRARGEQFARVLVRVLPSPDADVPRFVTGTPGPGADDELDVIDADESMTEDEDETLAEEFDTVDESDVDDDTEVGPARPRPTVPEPRAASVRGPARGRPASEEEKMVAHILEVFGAAQPGTRLTAGQINRTPSSVYPDRRPGQRAFAALIDSGTISGIEITVNRSGHRAVRLAGRRPAARRGRAQQAAG